MAEREWYYAKGDTRQGPVPESTLQDLVRQGAVGAATLVWTQGMTEWQRADQVPGLTLAGGIGPVDAVDVSGETIEGFRPTCVTVFGVLDIVFGGFGLLCQPFSLMSLNMPGMGGFGPGFKTWMVVSVIVGMIAAAALIALGIGLLKLKPWGRTGNIIYGWFAIVWGLAGIVITLALIMPTLEKSAGMGQAQAIGGMVGGAVGGIVGLIYPVLLLVFMNRQEVKDVFVRPG